MLTFIYYIKIYFTFAFLDCVHYNEDLVKSRFLISRFCSIHFIVILARLKKLVCYTKDLVIYTGLLNQGSAVFMGNL